MINNKNFKKVIFFISGVYDCLEKLSEEVGKKYLIGSVWMAILRSPRTKFSGLKYFIKNLPKLK